MVQNYEKNDLLGRFRNNPFNKDNVNNFEKNVDLNTINGIYAIY
jgi:hypothetical protein